MPDLSAVISAVLALVGALGGVALTNRNNVRREEAQFRREEAQFDRQLKDQQLEARRQAHRDLLGTAAQLKAEIEFVGLQYWSDMSVKLATIQQHAVAAGLHASRVAVLSPRTAAMALKLAAAASQLAADAASFTNMGSNQNQQPLGGQLTQAVDFTEFDQRFERLYHEAAQDGQG